MGWVVVADFAAIAEVEEPEAKPFPDGGAEMESALA
jgi:hypothetical protein